MGRAGRGGSDFERLLAPHMEPLWRTAFRFCGNELDAEELLQDFLVKLCPKVEAMRRVEDLRPWLLRSLHNHFVDGQRRRRRSPQPVSELETDERLSADAVDSMVCEGPGPEALAGHDDVSRRLIEAMNGLSREHRAVVALHDIEGYTLVELVEILEVPVGTLKSRLHRAREHLRVRLGNQSVSSDVYEVW